MKIISKHRDYYDSIQATGMDSSVTFHRENKIIRRDTEGFQDLLKLGGAIAEHRRFSHGEDYGNWYDIFPFVLSFCGEAFHYVGIKDNITGKISLCSDLDDYLKKLDERLFGFEYFEGNCELIDKCIANEFFTDKKRWEKGLSEMYMELKVPYFLVFPDGDHLSVEICPVLSDVGFVSVKDPYTAYQDIAMFVPGILGTNEAEIGEFSDDDKLAKHGYDKKSFRKRKTRKGE